MTILTAVMLAERRLPRTGGAMDALFVVAGISVTIQVLPPPTT